MGGSGAGAPGRGVGATQQAPLDTIFDRLGDLLALVERETVALVSALPGLPGDIGAVWRRLAEQQAGGLAASIGRLAIAALAMLGAFLLVRRLTRRWRERTVDDALVARGMVLFILLEVLALAAAAIVGRVMVVRFLAPVASEIGIGAALLFALMRWLVATTVAAVVFQPDIPSLRLAPLGDDGARLALRRVSVVFALGYLQAAAIPAAMIADFPAESAKLVSFIVATLMIVLGLGLIRGLRRHGLDQPSALAAGAVMLLVYLFWLWGLASRNYDLYDGAVRTLTVVIIALGLDRALTVSLRRARGARVARLMFLLRVTVGALAAAVILRMVVEFWVYGTFGWIGEEAWPRVSRGLGVASVTMVIGAVLAALIVVWTEARLSASHAAVTLGREERAQVSRLSTVLPFLQVAGVVTVVGAAALVALSALGVDVTPLMAGAGIVGLAISFGSQALVKDIVSGIFHTVDDVFRLGDIIETGSRKGRVERITLRTVRLRDESGKVHTIPLGELGSITNYSRDIVRLTAALPLEQPISTADLERLARLFAANVGTVKTVQNALVGEIERSVEEPAEGVPGRVVFAFDALAASVARLEPLVERGLAEAAADLRIPGLGRAATIARAAAPAPLPPVPAVEPAKLQ